MVILCTAFLKHIISISLSFIYFFLMFFILFIYSLKCDFQSSFRQNSQNWLRKKKQEWPVKAFSVSLDGFTKVSGKSTCRIEPWQFCLSGQIACLEVVEMIDVLHIILSDIIIGTVNNRQVLPLIEEITSYIHEYSYQSKHK